MKSEIHIVLIWEKGINKLAQILYDLKNSFDILDVTKVAWDNNFFSNNLTRFYGENLPEGSFKEKHCGKGPFISIILRDNNPEVSVEITSNDLKNIREKIKKTAIGIKRYEFEGKKGKHCDWCDYKDLICPLFG